MNKKDFQEELDAIGLRCLSRILDTGDKMSYCLHALDAAKERIVLDNLNIPKNRSGAKRK